MEQNDIRSKEEISDLLTEAFDRVWIDRKDTELFLSNEACQNAFTKAVDKYKDLEPVIGPNEKYIGFCTDEDPNFYHGFWSGILAAIRWVLGDEKWDFNT